MASVSILYASNHTSYPMFAAAIYPNEHGSWTIAADNNTKKLLSLVSAEQLITPLALAQNRLAIESNMTNNTNDDENENIITTTSNDLNIENFIPKGINLEPCLIKAINEGTGHFFFAIPNNTYFVAYYGKACPPLANEFHPRLLSSAMTPSSIPHVLPYNNNVRVEILSSDDDLE